MKKAYISPKTVITDLQNTENILASSYTNIGGTTDGFGVRSRGTRCRVYDIDLEENEWITNFCGQACLTVVRQACCMFLTFSQIVHHLFTTCPSGMAETPYLCSIKIKNKSFNTLKP